MRLLLEGGKIIDAALFQSDEKRPEVAFFKSPKTDAFRIFCQLPGDGVIVPCVAEAGDGIDFIVSGKFG